MKQTLWRNARLATLATAHGWGWIETGSLLTEGDQITWVGPMTALPTGTPIDAEHDVGGALLTPGLIDTHTHLESYARRGELAAVLERARTALAGA